MLNDNYRPTKLINKCVKCKKEIYVNSSKQRHIDFDISLIRCVDCGSLVYISRAENENCSTCKYGMFEEGFTHISKCIKHARNKHDFENIKDIKHFFVCDEYIERGR